MPIMSLIYHPQNVEKEIKKQGKSAENLASKRDHAAQKVAEVQANIDSLEFSESEFNNLDQEKNHLESAISDLTEVVDTLSAKLQGRLAFKYSDPVRGFDRNKVKGYVAKLVSVKDQKHSTALEVVAGGKLFHVVVDEAITGKALLDRGKLERRVTIIPLDKIKSRHISDSTSKQASSIAKSLGSTAMPAVELVGYDEEIRTAMEYVFGSSFVVDGMKAANQICDTTKTRTVTLDGDVYEPSGTISGGSNNNLGTTLAQLAQLSEATLELEEKKSRLQHVQTKLQSISSKQLTFEKLSSKLEIAQAELASFEKHLSQTSFGMLVESRDSMTKGLEEAKKESVEMVEEKEAKWKLYLDLKEKEEELTIERENRLGEIEKSVKQAKAEVAEKSKIAREVCLLTAF